MYKLKKQKNIKKQEHCICEFSSLTRKAPLDDPKWGEKKSKKKVVSINYPAHLWKGTEIS